MSRLTVTLIACAAGLAAAATANAQSVALTPESPVNGAVFAPQDAPYAIPLGWTSDITGCGVASTDGNIVMGRPGKLLQSDGVTGAAPAQTRVLDVATATPITYVWYARISCPAAPGGEIRSEERSFVVQGNPARLQGTFTVRAHGSPQVWKFTPTCVTGACNVRMTRRGQKAMTLVFNPQKLTYTGRFSRQNIAPERICRIKTTLDGAVLRNRTFRNVYAATNGRIVLSPRAMTRTTNPSIVGTFVGRQTAQYRHTTRGKRLGCPAGSRAAAPLVGVLR